MPCFAVYDIYYSKGGPGVHWLRQAGGIYNTDYLKKDRTYAVEITPEQAPQDAHRRYLERQASPYYGFARCQIARPISNDYRSLLTQTKQPAIYP